MGLPPPVKEEDEYLKEEDGTYHITIVFAGTCSHQARQLERANPRRQKQNTQIRPYTHNSATQTHSRSAFILAGVAAREAVLRRFL